MTSGSIPSLATFEAFAGAPSTCDQDAQLHLTTGPSSRQSLRGTSGIGRSLPIRLSQRYPPEGTPPFPPSPLDTLSEHSLRRKTPNGTVDEGYDGAPTQTSPTLPPLKYVVLAARGRVSSAIRTNTSLHPPTHDWNTPQQPAQLAHNHWAQAVAAAPSRSTTNTYLSPQLGKSFFPFGNKVFLTADIHPESQSIGVGAHKSAFRTNEYNLRAICRLPSQTIALSPSDPNTSPARSSSRERAWSIERSRGLIQGRSQEDQFKVERPALPHRMEHHDLTCSKSWSNFPHGKSDTFSFRGLGTSMAKASGFVQHTGDILGQSELRAYTLACAYECYVKLLASLQYNGRFTPLTMSGFGMTLKDTRRTVLLNAESEVFRTQQQTAICCRGGSNTPYCGSRCRYSQFSPVAEGNNAHGLHCQFSDITVTSARDGKHHEHASSAVASGLVPYSVCASPWTDAMSALKVLDDLCEQSDWRWLDGLLLGGCLQYGLGCYESALKRFSRILELDASHVEAIINMAATLCCLNRQTEAEQLWFRAVKLRPSCLEASEHLISLLYKRRTEEAVEIVSYVQRSLRNPSQPFINPESIHGNGHCLSGYGVPASENGRILALLHAKGTMLYSQSKVEKASEAFEEAILISTGWRFRSIHQLTRHIQFVFSPWCFDAGPSILHEEQRPPSMLPPEVARRTAQLAFAEDGDLPGLLSVRNGIAKKAAILTTSNSLLSLAKIIQDAVSNGNAGLSLSRGASTVGDILALYYLSLSLQESPSTANNVGILLAGIQQASSSPYQTFPSDTSQLPMPGVSPGSGMALAMAYYNYGLQLDPHHVHLHTNLGSLLKDMGQLDLAIHMYERAVLCDGTFDIALTNLANAVKDKGRIVDAIAYYRRAVNSNPGFDEAVCGLFTALNSVCSWRGRGGVLLRPGNHDKWHVDEEGKLIDARVHGGARGLAKRVVDIVAHQLREASHWGQHILQEPVIQAIHQQLQHLCEDSSFQLGAAIRQWAGKPWEGSRLTRLLERATRVALRKWYLDINVRGRGQLVSSRVRARLPPGLPVPTAPTLLPFHTFTCPLTASEVRAIAQRNALRISCSTLRSPWLPSALTPPPNPPNPQLNVGYLSSDFNNHPLAHLMQSVFGFHNPRRVRAFCYATTVSDRSVHRRQIEKEAPVFHDVSGWSPERVIEQIGRDHIHILVNLNGYTRGARNEIFAARPAPIQMSFMGFAGSLGAEWCDYILADETAVPPETLRPWRRNVSIEDVLHDNTECSGGEWVYSENVIFCRSTFFCCDHAQSSAHDENTTTWEEEKRRRWEMRRKLFPHMPDNIIILGNFNQLYKIEPTIFRSWLRILSRVPNAILWLLRFPEPGERNLRSTAEAWAGPGVARRLMFTDVAPKNQHISRARVCDLFLDTPECNAHTTAADVLWSSTPLLTLPRYPYKMCSRIAASILRAALPRSAQGRQVARELIADDEVQYEQLAIELAGKLVYTKTKDAGYKEGQGRLADIRQLLWENKWRCGLFDTRRWVEEVEFAYEEAWRRWVDGIGGDIHL